jgi:hypothetical protein
MREESHFKHVLLESLHGESFGALQELLGFQRKFPRGVYATVIRVMREILVGQVYRERQWNKDPAALIRFVEEHQEYLSACVDQHGFLEKVSAAYAEAGRPIELIKLFNYLVERQWAAPGVPYMYEEIANNAELLGDTALEGKSLRTLLRKYPATPHARQILERLGAIAFADNKHREVKETLLWLLNKGERAHHAESLYYLGRSLCSLKEYSPAAKAIDLYLAATKSAGMGFVPDAYFVGVSARESAGDRKGALRLLDAGLKLSENPRSEEFLYKAGELNLLDGNKQSARSYFGQIIAKGKDPDWQKLAQQALQSLDVKNPR